MLSDIEIQISDWNKSKFEETDSLPLMTTPGPVVLILVTYLLFIYKIGPSYMKNKEPYKLTTVLILYNTFQIVFSAYLVKQYFIRLFRQGLVPKSCLINDESHRNEILFGMWLYFAAKVSELLDTVFFVMRKKFNQITILHVYHHSSMLVGTWACLKYWPSETLFFIGFINSLVHVFMYTYYGLAALGPKVEKYIFWKKYMTKFQLVQLISIVVHYIVAVRRSECPPASGVATFVTFTTVVFLILFLHFYWQSYIKRGKIPSIRVCHHIEKED